MKFDMYCDWSPFGIGIVVVEQGKGVFYKRCETDKKLPQQGEMQAIGFCLDIVEELGLENVTVHTDHQTLVNCLKSGTPPMSKKKKGEDRIKHQKMYSDMMERVTDLGVMVVYCRAHNDDELSNAADILTRKPAQDSFEKRLQSYLPFHEKALELTPQQPTFWDVAKTWWFNLTYGAMVA